MVDGQREDGIQRWPEGGRDQKTEEGGGGKVTSNMERQPEMRARKMTVEGEVAGPERRLHGKKRVARE